MTQVNILQELLAGFNLSQEKKDLSNEISKESRYSLNLYLSEAGIEKLKVKKILFLFIVYLSILIFVISTTKIYPLLLLIFLPGILLCFFLLSKRRARIASFEKDYTAFLLAFASGVRTGLDPLQFMSNAAKLFSKNSCITEELGKFSEKIQSGASEDEVIETFAQSIPHPDLALFRSCLLISRKQGASLSECLQRLARVTRQRQSFRRKLRSAVAMQKLSAFGIGGCAIVIGVMQFLSSKEAFTETLNNPLGVKLISGGFFAIFAGITWMLWLARAKV